MQEVPPLLSDALRVIGGRIPIVVELKPQKTPQATKELTQLSNELLKDYEGPFCVESFHPGQVKDSDKSFVRGQLGAMVEPIHCPSLFLRLVICHFLANFTSRPNYLSICWDEWHKSLVGLVPKFWKDTPLLAWTIHNQKEADEVINNPHFFGFVFEGFIPEKK